MQLEQMFGYQPRVAQEERQQTYFVVGDLESLSASALYMADKQYNFIDFQFSLHETDDKITGAKLKLKGVPRSSLTERKLSGYEAAMGDLYAQNLNIPTIKKGS